MTFERLRQAIGEAEMNRQALRQRIAYTVERAREHIVPQSVMRATLLELWDYTIRLEQQVATMQSITGSYYDDIREN